MRNNINEKTKKISDKLSNFKIITLLIIDPSYLFLLFAIHVLIMITSIKHHIRFIFRFLREHVWGKWF